MKKTQTNIITPMATTETSRTSHPSEEEIARRAYELWLRDGCPTGQAVHHWHEAERQLQKDKAKPRPSVPQALSIPNDRSLASFMDESSPYNALEKEAPLSVKVERSLAKTNIKSLPSSGGAVNLD